MNYTPTKKPVYIIYTKNNYLYLSLSFLLSSSGTLHITDINNLKLYKYSGSGVILDLQGETSLTPSVMSDINSILPECIFILSSFKIKGLNSVSPVRFFTKQITLKNFILLINKREEVCGRFIPISLRQYRILVDILSGMDAYDIVNKAEISVTTVYVYKKNIMKIMEVRNDAALLKHPACLEINPP
ncbi:hypothetical protein QHH40_004442 [Salmonella enterica]|nr:hypothetical protein [Salmonella enterica]ELL3053335.1 hypothetical protein [Salmonella enterica]